MVDKIVVTTFAPVVIPTLCRYQHFRNCLETLAQCTWAEYTEVYVGLDYPLNESHCEGYDKIKNYLEHFSVKNRFKKLHVIMHKTNQGVAKNLKAICDVVSARYDRWIFSEDDNIFSPNFLVFINKGLEKFKNDPTVISINGYRHFYDIQTCGNSFFRQNVDFSAWGYGIWKDRYEAYKDIDRKYFRRHAYSLKSMAKMWRNGYMRLAGMYSCAGKHWNGSKSDNVLSVYMALEDMDVIMPVVSCVRNCGVDGSGVHFVDVDRNFYELHQNQVIDDKDTFHFIGTGLEYYIENKRAFRTQSYGRISIFQLFRIMVKFYLSELLGGRNG